MAFRNIVIESPARISLKNDQLVIRTDAERSAAIEDISALLIENRQTQITAAAHPHALCMRCRRRHSARSAF